MQNQQQQLEKKSNKQQQIEEEEIKNKVLVENHLNPNQNQKSQQVLLDLIKAA